MKILVVMRERRGIIVAEAKKKLRQSVKRNILPILILLAFIVGASFFVASHGGGLQGDGAEYVMQVAAFQNHGSFGITEDDIKLASRDFPMAAEYIQNEFYVNPWDHLHEYHGAMYSNHYGSYSALVVPIKLIIQNLGYEAIWAFGITNIILYSIALLCVIVLLRTDIFKKVCVLLLLTINPAFFYLYWTHSEVYIFSFAVIGLVFFYNKQYGRGILFLSIAAMQNLGILPFAMMVGIDYIITRGLEYKEKNQRFNLGGFVKSYWLKIIPYGLFYIPAFIPILSTYTKFHTFNLVADVAMEHKYLFSKAMNYLFDLNLGILPFEPVMLVLFFIVAIAGLKKNTRAAIINILGIGGMLYIVANQIQINCGMQYIMRYNVWILPMILFFTIMHWNISRKQLPMVICTGAQGIYLLLTIILLANGHGSYTSDQFSPWSKLVMDKAPALYNPTHGIFYSRALGQESYASSVPVFYATKDGYIRKILVSQDAEDAYHSEDFRIVDGSGQTLDKTSLHGVKTDEGEYTYYNFSNAEKVVYTYPVGTELSFNSGDDVSIAEGRQYFNSGLSSEADYGTWTDGKKVIASFWLDQYGEPLNVRMHIAGVCYQPQKVSIIVNGEQAFKETLSGEEDIEFTFTPTSNLVQMELSIPDAVKPSEIGNYTDNRDLGILLTSMTIQSVG